MTAILTQFDLGSLRRKGDLTRHLTELQPSAIVSANIGCIGYLQSGTSVPVKHWIEALDEALDGATAK